LNKKYYGRLMLRFLAALSNAKAKIRYFERKTDLNHF